MYVFRPIWIVACLSAGFLFAEGETSPAIIFDSPEYPPDYVRYAGEIYNRSESGDLSVYSVNASLGTVEVVIGSVPPYIWHHGCAPTAAGMLLGYYDTTGWQGMITNSDVNPSSVSDNDYQSIASTAHYQDYCLPMDEDGDLQPDKSSTGGAHSSNCVADYMYSSFSSQGNTYGATSSGDIEDGVVDYMQAQYPELDIWSGYAYVHTGNVDDIFATLRARIDANHPVILGIDSSGEGIDHAVIMVGYRYNASTGLKQYIAYNTWDNDLHTYNFEAAYYKNRNNYLETFVQSSVGMVYSVYPEANSYRAVVYKFYRPAVGSYFFTANPDERNILLNTATFQYQGVSHYVYGSKVLSQVVPVYRFLNSLGSHFYTATESEKQSVIANLSHIYTLEGIAFYALASPVGNAKPVYRFFQSSTKSHYFTISETDKAERIANDPTMQYEGIAWYAFSN